MRLFKVFSICALVVITSATKLTQDTLSSVSDDACAIGCTEEYIGNGFCDAMCNHEACNRDEGDCDSDSDPTTCDPECDEDMIGDGTCDEVCNNPACGYDGEDCADTLGYSAAHATSSFLQITSSAKSTQTAPSLNGEWAGRKWTWNIIQFNGSPPTSDLVFDVQPGQRCSMQVAVSTSFENSWEHYCPECMVQLYFGIKDAFSKGVIEHGIHNDHAFTTVEFDAPSTSGDYYVKADITIGSSFQAITHANSAHNAFAMLKVVGSTEEDQLVVYPQMKGDFTTAVELNSNGSQVVNDIGEQAFNQAFRDCPAVEYVRNGQTVAYYKRISKIPAGFNAYKLFTDMWASQGNIMGSDFKLFSNFDDFKYESNAWRFCNYDEPDVGFPRDCGPYGSISDRFFSMPGGQYDARGVTGGAGFKVCSLAPGQEISAGPPPAEVPGHTGPVYEVPLSAEMDHGSQTYDNARGGLTVEWYDGMNQKHNVDVSNTWEVRVQFPIGHGGNWNWKQGDGSMERTGFNAAVTWVDATFTQMSENRCWGWWNCWTEKYVQISATGFRTRPTDTGVLEEIKDRVTDVRDLAVLGAQTVEEVMSVANMLGMIPIPPISKLK